MKKNQWVSDKAVCPFYKKEAPSVIYCEGSGEGVTVHIAFSDRAKAAAYKKQMCRFRWMDCPYAKLNEKREG